MFDDTSCQKSSRLFTESINAMTRDFSCMWDDRIHESFRSYIGICTEQGQNVEDIVEEIRKTYEELATLDAERIIFEAELCYEKAGSISG